MEEYIKQDREQYLKQLLAYAVGHLCFECRRPLSHDENMTVELVGLFPVYHHTACLYSEDETQRIVEDNAATGKPIIS